MSRAWAGYAGLLLLCACARPDAAPMADNVSAEPTQAVADLLAMADHAARDPKRDGQRLSDTLAALDQLGARPADPAADPLPGWREALPSKMAQPLRGRMLGPAYRRGTLAAGASMTLMQLFDGGRQARVAVAAAGAMPLRMAVLDDGGKAVCPDHVAPRGACRWVPPFSGRHQIIVTNAGDAPSAYYLVID
jgi:hypothetical protein